MAQAPVSRKLGLTRDQLAAFLQDHEQIRQFENLFALVDAEVAPNAVTEATILAGSADARAQQALDTLERMTNALEALAAAPAIQSNNSAVTDYIDLNRLAPFLNADGRLGWNALDNTMNIGHADGVVQQVGQEVYMRVVNKTGSPIPNGTAVGFAGVNGLVRIEIAPYLADGSAPNLYFIGVSTQDLDDDEVGFVTIYGRVSDIDTTGTPVGEVWAVGDLLWAHPTIAGALTKVKPTAPDNVVSVAAVLAVDATAGQIMVRPTIELNKNYGVFSDSSPTQTLGAIYTPQAITFDTTDIASGVSRGTPTSQIVVAESGLYQFSFSAQFESGSASTKRIWIWPRINGNDVANSNSEVTISGAGTTLVASWSWTLSMTAGQYFDMVFAADDVGVTLVSKAAHVGANGTAAFARPAVPCIILEVAEVQQ